MKCYCDKEKEFSDCCEKYLSGKEIPDKAADLMRSRYSAFCTVNLDYLQQTTDLQVRYEFDRAATEAWAKNATFNGLEIMREEDGGNKSIVEFKAKFHLEKEDHVHHEVSTFRKTNGQWFFRAGRVIAP